MLLLYLTTVPDALGTHTPLAEYHYNLAASCEDAVALSLLRCVAVVAAYLAGAGPQYQR